MKDELYRTVSRRQFLAMMGGAALSLAAGCAFPAKAVEPIQKAARILSGKLDARFLRQIIARLSLVLYSYYYGSIK